MCPISKSKYNIVLGVLYRAHNSYLHVLISNEKLLNTICKENKYSYLMGDFNVNIWQHTNNTTI